MTCSDTDGTTHGQEVPTTAALGLARGSPWELGRDHGELSRERAAAVPWTRGRAWEQSLRLLKQLSSSRVLSTAA